jgi:TolA-binding protein
VSLVNLKKHAEAADALSKFIKQFPKSALNESASLLCGESYFNASRHENAIDPLERARRSKDKKISGPATLRLGDVYAALNRWSESESTFEDYLERFQDDPQAFQARFGVAWALENLGRHEQAINAYRKVISPGHCRLAQFQGSANAFFSVQEAAAAELLR